MIIFSDIGSEEFDEAAWALWAGGNQRQNREPSELTAARVLDSFFGNGPGPCGQRRERPGMLSVKVRLRDADAIQ